MNCNAPIGVFDSGVGGLTVAREIMRQLPDERMVYFGDTARLPYGTKSKATVIRYSLQIVRFLKTKGVKAIVVACNTATAQALEEIQAEVDIPVLGVIGALTLGAGMCMVMVWDMLVFGIAVGLVGLVLLLCLIPLVKGLR